MVVEPRSERMPSPTAARSRRRAAGDGGPVVQLDGVVKRYGKVEVLAGVDLALRPGDALLVRGRSGSGKSTLLHLLAGIDTPTAGRVRLAGQDLGGLDASARARLRLQNVGLVFQHFNLLPDLTAEENVRLPLRLAAAPQAPAKAKAQGLLERVGLAHRATAFPGSMSGGELQRVAVARALANDPPLILADEPTANLDEASAKVVLTMLGELAKEGRAVLVASHDSLALRVIPEVYEIVAGTLVPSDRVVGEQRRGDPERDGREA